MENPPEKSDKMLSFHDFCKYFGIDDSIVHIQLVNAYILYQNDFSRGGFVSPDNYYSKTKP